MAIKKSVWIVGGLIVAGIAGYFIWKKMSNKAVDSLDESKMQEDLNTAKEAVRKITTLPINQEALKWKEGDVLYASKDTKGFLIVPKIWEQYKKGDKIGTFRSIAPDPKTPSNYWALYVSNGGRYAQIELGNAKK